MSAPKVSIGMPVYNGEELLPETLESILAQTFGDFEVVVSDNASTDATQEICRSYARRDERIRYERTDHNIPVTHNFNRACRLSHGRYFKWQAHDDLLAPEFLSRCVEILDQDPTMVLAATRVRLIEEDGSPVPLDAEKGMFVTSYGEPIPVPSPPGSDALASPERVQRFRSVLFDIHGVTEAQYIFGLFRSETLAGMPLVGAYFGADKVLLARLSLVGRFREVPQELFLRRYHSGHMGASSGNTWRGRIRLAKRLAPNRRFIVLPLARQVGGYFQAIRDAEITTPEKIRCGAMVIEKVANVSVDRVRRVPSRMRDAFARR